MVSTAAFPNSGAGPRPSGGIADGRPGPIPPDGYVKPVHDTQ